MEKLYQNIYHRVSLGNNRAICEIDGEPGLIVILHKLSAIVLRLFYTAASDFDYRRAKSVSYRAEDASLLPAAGNCLSGYF